MIDCSKIPNLVENHNFLANHSTYGAVVIDMEGTLMTNDSACKLMGYSSLKGMNFRDIAPPPYQKLFKPEHMEKGYGSVLRQFLRCAV